MHATSKKDKCKGIVNTAIPILKKLFKESPSDNIKVRSLVVRSLDNMSVINEIFFKCTGHIVGGDKS